MSALEVSTSHLYVQYIKRSTSVCPSAWAQHHNPALTNPTGSPQRLTVKQNSCIKSSHSVFDLKPNHPQTATNLTSPPALKASCLLATIIIIHTNFVSKVHLKLCLLDYDYSPFLEFLWISQEHCPQSYLNRQIIADKCYFQHVKTS